ncbi:transcriptional regulator [Tistrella bauzanensis]|uniref:Transcriptional regulator n=1 Tax=Tistrella bauzanensis TaxID=657419 RepID=A0ABQ1IFC8_9PROT|nr:MarR family winged helix-turn-helix transcriptional regulator [Tistrella bauzanensis]GGB37916.1 transcriptional regulator [Tistrella bauzanensis]
MPTPPSDRAASSLGTSHPGTPAHRTSRLMPCTCQSLRKAARQVTRLYDGMLQPSGLRLTQFSVLAALRLDGAMPLTRLADLLVVERTTLTRNLKPLERAGLIETRPDDNDGRRRVLAITTDGRAAFRSALPLWQAAQDAVAGRLGADLQARMMADLAVVIRACDRPA